MTEKKSTPQVQKDDSKQNNSENIHSNDTSIASTLMERFFAAVKRKAKDISISPKELVDQYRNDYSDEELIGDEYVSIEDAKQFLDKKENEGYLANENDKYVLSFTNIAASMGVNIQPLSAQPAKKVKTESSSFNNTNNQTSMANQNLSIEPFDSESSSLNTPDLSDNEKIPTPGSP